jgi:hypothetical protein
MKSLTTQVLRRNASTSAKGVTRDAIMLGAAIVGAALFFGVPQFGLPAAVAGSVFGGISAGAALLRPRGMHTSRPAPATERRQNERRAAG